MTANVNQGKLVQSAIQGLRNIADSAKAGALGAFAYTTGEMNALVLKAKNRQSNEYENPLVRTLEPEKEEVASTTASSLSAKYERKEVKLNPEAPVHTRPAVLVRNALQALSLIAPTKELRTLAQEAYKIQLAEETILRQSEMEGALANA